MDTQQTNDMRNEYSNIIYLLTKTNQILEKNFKVIIELLGEIHIETKYRES